MKRPLRTLASLISATAIGGTQFFLSPLPVKAQIFNDNNGCPLGTTQTGQNRVINGDFAIQSGIPGAPPTAPVNPPVAVPPALGFTSDLPYRGDNSYPDDPIGGLSIQDLTIPPNPDTYNGNILGAVPFPGDPANGIPPSNRFLYSNPNQNLAGGSALRVAPEGPIVWRQTITGLAPNTTYNFSAYFFNLLTNAVGFSDPVISLRVGPPGFVADSGTSPVLSPPLPSPGFTVAVRQQWIPVQVSFTTAPGQTAVDLVVVDTANTVFGDDFGFTAVGLRECTPTIGVSKQAGTPVNNGNGTFTIPYTVRVRNFAPAGTGLRYDLLNLQLSDNLTTTFAAATSFQVQPGSIQSPALTVNPNFTGVLSAGNPRSNDLLLGGDTLAAGSTATVQFNIIVTPGTGPDGFGVFPNQIAATATSRGGTPVTALSNNGANPDINNNGLPDPPSVTPVTLPRFPIGPGGGPPSFRLVKRITGVTRNGAPLPGVNFNTFVNDPGSTDDDAPGWAQFPPLGLITLDPSNPLQSGDQVTYTVYYLSDGQANVTAANICDPVPGGTAFVPNSTLVQQSSGSPFAGGAFFPPLVPLPPNNACSSQTNTNGSVLFDVGDVPNTAGNNFGFVRFRVTID